MAVDGIGNKSLETISDSYQARDTEKNDDTLGLDSFLTMLVAQLQNQDPLNPMEGTEFSSQLAQFSQLEQLINLNENVENLDGDMGNNTAQNLTDYIGMEVTGKVDTIDVDGGTPTAGFYNLEQNSEVKVSIYDDQGREIRTLFPGQQEVGSHGINWDGRNNNGATAKDGSYSYVVLANTGSGYAEVPTTVSGRVESVIYNNGKPYLEVNGVLVDPGSLTQLQKSEENSEQVASALDYLGKDAATSDPLVLVDNSTVQGGGIAFNLDVQEPVIITIKDSAGNAVKTITLASEDVAAGGNTVSWDGTATDGNPVGDGIYSYDIETASGGVAKEVSGEISGIQNVQGTQYLAFKNSGLLTRLADLISIN